MQAESLSLRRASTSHAYSKAVLYEEPFSYYCVSAKRMLVFRGVPFKSVYVSYHDKRELLKSTGQDYVPALLWNGKPVFWYDISDSLERKQPRPTLYPGWLKGLAVVLEHRGHQVLEEQVWRHVVTKVPPHLRDDHDRWVFEEMQTRARGPWHILEMRQREFKEDMEEQLASVDAMLDGRDWVLEEPGLADFGIYGGMYPFFFVGDAVLRSLPRLARWVQRVAKLGT
jgi:glutathione S-transferase